MRQNNNHVSNNHGPISGSYIQQKRLKYEVKALSVSFNDSLMAVGAQSSVLFYDLRSSLQSNMDIQLQNSNCNDSFKSSRPLGQYSNTHSDEITQLLFHPRQQQVLVSAGEDGLMSVFDTSRSSEEDAVMSILNNDCPIQKMGFFGHDSEGIYCLSTIETASLWHFPSAQRLLNFTGKYYISCYLAILFNN